MAIDRDELNTLCEMIQSASVHSLERYQSERDRFAERARQLAGIVQENAGIIARAIAEADGEVTPKPLPQSSSLLGVNDPTVIKCHVLSCITSLRDEDGRAKSRELSLAVTKLQESAMWIDEHLRLS